jgi:hypothetical protein
MPSRAVVCLVILHKHHIHGSTCTCQWAHTHTGRAAHTQLPGLARTHARMRMRGVHHAHCTGAADQIQGRKACMLQSSPCLVAVRHAWYTPHTTAGRPPPTHPSRPRVHPTRNQHRESGCSKHARTHARTHTHGPRGRHEASVGGSKRLRSSVMVLLQFWSRSRHTPTSASAWRAHGAGVCGCVGGALVCVARETRGRATLALAGRQGREEQHAQARM